MKSTGLVVVASLSFSVATAWAADATSPVDATQRNTPFAPTTTGPIAPDRQLPKDKANETVQEKRFGTTTIERKDAPVGERRAAIDVQETRDKNVREKDSRRPEVIEQPTSAYNHRQSAISTSTDTNKPPTVAKYQDRLTSATATNMARFPALNRATNAKINRFVFRKNPSETAAPVDGATVTAAAGGSVIQK